MNMRIRDVIIRRYNLAESENISMICDSAPGGVSEVIVNRQFRAWANKEEKHVSVCTGDAQLSNDCYVTVCNLCNLHNFLVKKKIKSNAV